MDEATESPETPHIWIRGEGGSIIKLDLPLHESIEERLLKGYIARVNEDGTAYIEGADNLQVVALPQYRPALSDSKPVWVGWAVANGMTPDDAEAATKQDLIEKFGAEPAPVDAGQGPAPEPNAEPGQAILPDGTPEPVGEDGIPILTQADQAAQPAPDAAPEQ